MKAVPQTRDSEKDWRKSFYYIQLIIIMSNYHYDNMKEVLPSHNLLMDIALSMFDLWALHTTNLPFPCHLMKWKKHQRSISQNTPISSGPRWPTSYMRPAHQQSQFDKFRVEVLMESWWHLHISHPGPSRWPHHWHQRLHGSLLVHGDEPPLPSIFQWHKLNQFRCFVGRWVGWPNLHWTCRWQHQPVQIGVLCQGHELPICSDGFNMKLM